MGRFLQEHYGQKPQSIMTLPLLPGLDGVAKMSKSLGNAISLNEEPTEAFGKIMSISDELMWMYYELLLHLTKEEIDTIKKTVHPLEAKKQLAYKVITRFWNEENAQKGLTSFEALFQKKDFSAAQEFTFPKETKNPLWIIELVKVLGAASSSSEARRLIEAGAVTIDGTKITNSRSEISWSNGMHIRIGKHRFYKIV